LILWLFLGENFNIFPNNTIICTMLNINQKIEWPKKKLKIKRRK
jgi:hypothetical protein